MRKLAFLILLLFIPTLILAQDFDNLKPNDEVEDEGWNITIIRHYEDNSVLLQVFLNPNYTSTTKVELGEDYLFDGIYINLNDSFYDADPAFSLIKLKTDIIWKNDCDKATDCDDGDTCTTELCTGYPLDCAHKNITSCINDDGCCQTGVGCTWKKDSDCLQYTSCSDNKDCNDLNISTNDTCVKDICTFTEIWWCETDDKICPDNCTYTNKIIDNRDLDCSPDSTCISNLDCDDNNDSTIDLCRANPSTNPKKCYYELTKTPIIKIKEKIDTTEPAKNKSFFYNKPLKVTEEYIHNIFLAEENRNRTLLILGSVFGVLLVVYIRFLIKKFKEESES
jgi:hypothetical protein